MRAWSEARDKRELVVSKLGSAKEKREQRQADFFR